MIDPTTHPTRLLKTVAGLARWLLGLLLAFWLLLTGFVAWDFASSAPVNLRLEPPLITAGSGSPASGGHCAMPK